MPEDLPSSKPMKSPSLSRRIYDNSLALALSFSFYALLFLCTLSCEGEATATLPLQNLPEEAVQQHTSTDSTTATSSKVVSYVEEFTK